MADPAKLRVFVDADVLIAGAASPTAHSASLVVLQMAEITLIEALTSEQVIEEAERNLREKLPGALATFRLLVERCLRVVSAPDRAALEPYQGLADSKDLPILIAAVLAECPWLVTFNVRHYQPGHPTVKVVTPGELVMHARDTLSQLGS
ncbi:MAG: PIN domain-containing protein [Anaerolineae bacterium]